MGMEIDFEVLNNILQRLTAVENTLKTFMERLDHDLFGNGQPGILAEHGKRIHQLEVTLAIHTSAIDTKVSNSDRAWVRFSPFIPWIGAILIAALAYFVGTKKG